MIIVDLGGENPDAGGIDEIKAFEKDSGKLLLAY
jgi:hypothetical protein